MRKVMRVLNRPAIIIVALVTGLVTIIPAFSRQAYAYSEITNRSVALSSSVPAATNVTYTISFKPATTGTVEGVVLNLCDNDPIIGDACTSSASSASLGTLTLPTNPTGMSDTTHWSVGAGSNSGTTNDGIIIALTDSTSDTFTAGTAVTFTVAGITNPNYNSGNCNSTTVCSFFGRIITYNTTAQASNYSTSSGVSGTPIDAGGVALSTAAQINITAKVAETLAFCVYNDGGSTSSTCTSGGSAPGFLLGNQYGVLSSGGPYVDLSTMYSVQTNAGSGVIVNIYGNTLETAGNTANIPGINPSATADTGGTSQFGLCNWEESGTAGELVPFSSSATDTYSGTASSGTTAVACSDTSLSQTAGLSGGTGGAGSGTTAPLFYFGTNASNPGGDDIASVSRGQTVYGQIAFAGNTSASQQAGVYTTSLDMIANGTF